MSRGHRSPRSPASAIVLRAGVVTASLLAGAAVALAEPSCTIFNGVEFREDAGTPKPDSGPPPETDHYLSIADATKACKWVATCPEPFLRDSIAWSTGLLLDPFNFSQCLSWLSGPIDKNHPGVAYQRNAYACIADAASCGAASLCNNAEFMPDSDPRCAVIPDAGGPNFCSADGKQVLDCDPTYTFESLHCDDPLWGQPSPCGVAVSDGFVDCAFELGCTSTSTCVGDVYDSCGSDGLRTKFDCSAVGATCNIDSITGGVACVTDGKYDACDNVSRTTCTEDGQRVRMCDDGWFAIMYDCSEIGGSCQASGSSAFCTVPGDECTVADDDENICDKTSIAVCVGGHKTTVDCASIGGTCTGSAGKAVCN